MRTLLYKLLSALLAAALLLPCFALAEDIAPQAIAEEAVEAEDVLPDAIDDAVEEEAEADLDDAPLFEAEPPVIEETVDLVEEADVDEAEKLMAPDGEIAIDATHFPDAAFRSYVSGFDVDKSGGLSDMERNKVDSIDLSNYSATEIEIVYTAKIDARSLKGIAYFPNLSYLRCAGLNLGSLDLSGNPKLATVICSSCGLTSLTLGSLPALAQLDCRYNAIATLDLTGCPKIVQYISSNYYACGGVKPEISRSSMSYSDNPAGQSTVRLDCDLTTAIVGGSPVTIVTQKKITVPVGTVFSAYDPNYSAIVTNRYGTSSNKKVVKKNSNGSWTAKAKGKAKITTVPVGKKKKILVLTVTVVKATAPATPVVAPENAITVTKNMKTSVLVGTTHQIFLNGKTGKGFKSSKKKVATVDKSGNIAAVGAGKTKITFKVGKKKHTLTLTVVDPTMPTAIYLDKSGTVAAKVGEPQTITAAFPAGTTSDIKWTSSNKKVATVANGVVTFKKKGKVTITATAVKGKKKAKVKFVVSK